MKFRIFNILVTKWGDETVVLSVWYLDTTVYVEILKMCLEYLGEFCISLYSFWITGFNWKSTCF